MTDARGAKVPKLAVYGSCVSRDAVEKLGPGRYELRTYVARQSLLSVGHDASGLLPEDLGLKHAFQERMVRGDWRGDLWAQIDSAAEFDVLLWDLTDERHGVSVFADRGVATISVDAISTDAVNTPLKNGLTVPFGSGEHFDAWKSAVADFAKELRNRNLWEKVLVIKTPWATTSREGVKVPSSLGLDADEANKLFVPYYYHLESMGFDVLSVEGDVFGDPEHRWGLAPFHYVPEVYDEIDAGIMRRFRRLEAMGTQNVSKS